MPKHILTTILSIGALVWMTACQSQPSEGLLSPKDFQKFKKDNPSALLLDVRTPEEFANGHLEGAKNIDYYGDFSTAVKDLPKEKPVMVYCLSGGRSHSASEMLKSMGFTKVVELQGGITKWRAQQLPETLSNTRDNGMQPDEFQKLIHTKGLVVIDFYAPWCQPCKKMEPYLTEMQQTMQDKVTIYRIHADENKSLFQSLHLEALPAVLVYSNGTLKWQKTGFVSKEELLQQIIN